MKAVVNLIVFRFVEGQFIAHLDPTIEDIYRKNVGINGICFLFDILDTASEETSQALKDRWFEYGDILFLVFALNNEKSFESIDRYYEHALFVREGLSPMIMVGNKCDLNMDGQYKDIQQRAIDKAYELNIPYVETSAMDGTNIQLLFQLSLYEYWIQSTHNE